MSTSPDDIPSFSRWMAALENAERLIRAYAPDRKVLAAMHEARDLDDLAIGEIRLAASARLDPRKPYLYRFEGRTFLIMPDGVEFDLAERLSGRVSEIDPGRQVAGPSGLSKRTGRNRR